MMPLRYIDCEYPEDEEQTVDEHGNVEHGCKLRTLPSHHSHPHTHPSDRIAWQSGRGDTASRKKYCTR